MSRHRPSAAESWASGTILLLLGLIALSILLQHERDRRPLAGLSAEPMTGSGETQALLAPLLEAMPHLEALGPAEHFSRERLADKINGKAELYLPAGFEHLTTQRFQAGDAPGQWFELFLYGMGRPDNAFAVYSTQRREGVRPVAGVDQGYATANALFLVLGSTYVELIGSHADQRLLAAMEQAALALAQALDQSPGVPRPPTADTLFPPARRVPDSLALLSADAFGMAGLDQVYTAQYQVADAEFTAFLSIRASADDARDLAASYGRFLMEFGGRDLALEGLPQGCRAIDILDLCEVICSRDAYLYGVHEAPAREAARDLTRTLADALNEARNESSAQ